MSGIFVTWDDEAVIQYSRRVSQDNSWTMFQLYTQILVSEPIIHYIRLSGSTYVYVY